MQFGQQVAVGQGELIAIQEAADRELVVVQAVGVNLIGQGSVQIVVQFLQGSGQTLF